MNVFDKIIMVRKSFVLECKGEWTWKYLYGKHYFKVNRDGSHWKGDNDNAIMFLFHLSYRRSTNISLLKKVNPTDYKDVFIKSAKSLLKYAWSWYYAFGLNPPLDFVDIYAEECMKDIEKLFEEKNDWEHILSGVNEIYKKYNDICYYSLK